MQILKKCDELLYNSLEVFDFDSFESKNTNVQTAKDGTQIITYQNDDYEWFFNSKFEPIQVAKDWVSQVGKIETLATVVMFGLGNGMILKNFIKATNDSVIFIIYEPSVDIFLLAMNEIDFSFLENRVFMVVEGINEEYLEIFFQSFVKYENLSVCKFIGHPNYWSCFSLESKNYFLKLQALLKHMEANENTKLRMGEGYYKNVLMNIKQLGSSSILDQIKDSVGNKIPESLPAIIISAGPSLSKNIKELKKARNKAFLIATDSALIGLLDEEIIPDVYVTIDPLKPLNRFKDERINKIPLICTESARFEVVESNMDKKIFANDSYGYGNAFLKELDHPYQLIDQGGSVATFAYSIAKNIGFTTILLVGQDLAFTDDTRYYDQVKEWSDIDVSSGDNYVVVEDIYGHTIKTSKDMAYYLEWFEKQIQNDVQIEVIDATEGGARIKGSKIMTLSKAIDEKCKIDFDMTAYLRGIPDTLNDTKKQKLSELIKKVPQNYEELYDCAKRGIELYQSLIDLLQDENSSTSKMAEVTRKIGQISKQIEDNPVYFHAQHKIILAEHIALNNLGVSLEEQVDDALQTAARGMVILDSLRMILEDGVLKEVKQVCQNLE